MSADTRTDPPTPDPLLPDPRPAERLTGSYRRGYADALAALPSAPDQRLREALRHISEDANHSPDFRHAVGSQPHCGPCIAYNALRAALSEATTSPETTLDVAWREVGAALPDKRWSIWISGSWEDGWEAEYSGKAGVIKTNDSGWFHDPGDLPTPAAALSALAARLRGPA